MCSAVLRASVGAAGGIEVAGYVIAQAAYVADDAPYRLVQGGLLRGDETGLMRGNRRNKGRKSPAGAGRA